MTRSKGKKMSHYNYDEHKSQQKAKINTQHVSLSQNTVENVRGKELKVVWDHMNG